MAARNTRTGGVLESMILPALRLGGYTYQSQVNVGTRLGGRKHMVDVVAEKGGRRLLVSLKWQQVGGTAEQKVPFEVLCLMDAVRKGGSRYDKAYLVLGGDGWTLRDFYVSGGLEEYLKYSELVDIVRFETFIGNANKGSL